ncbi:MAG TPA: hypothetical protein VF178_01840 [Gemmatimonadaceae bacterium]
MSSSICHVIADHPLSRGQGYELAAALRRLGELYDAQNDRAKTLEYSGAFVDLWANADPDRQPLCSRRARMAALAGEPPRLPR